MKCRTAPLHVHDEPYVVVMACTEKDGEWAWEGLAKPDRPDGAISAARARLQDPGITGVCIASLEGPSLIVRNGTEGLLQFFRVGG